ncbi:MAG: metG, partial [Conexibacter sp.]|nr:metG [Conexibacter sp.]
VIDKYVADALRFYLLRDVSFGQDGSVSTADFEKRYESELANDFGNLASRTIKMLLRYRDGAVPQVDLDPTVVAEFDGLADRVGELVGRAELTPALEEIWVRVRRLNAYVGDQEPWKMAKDDARAAELDQTLATLVEGLRVVTVLLHAWIPERAGTLMAALGFPDLEGDVAPALAIGGARLGASLPTQVADLDPLFPKQQQPPKAA